MAVIDCGNGIYKDNSIVGDEYKTYTTGGQGCSTIWFKSAVAARLALENSSVRDGSDLFDCKKCACHYSFHDPKFKELPMHACRDEKINFAKSFE